MLRDGKVFRILSDRPIELQVLEFKEGEEGDQEHLLDLEAYLPNEINVHEGN